MKIAILFGGISKEREVSFASGRTVYDSLDRSLFTPVPIFVDSLSNFILLDWQHLYKGTIRDFYPPTNKQSKKFQTYIENLGALEEEEINKIISTVGRKILPHEFHKFFDFAFLALHGPGGEDGSIQGLLEWHGIPYSGTGILGSAICLDKISQKFIIQSSGFNTIPYQIIDQQQWLNENKQKILDHTINHIKLPLVIKSTNQGSSIGVSILKERDEKKFVKLVNHALGIYQINPDLWKSSTEKEKIKKITSIIDLTEGIALPVVTQTNEIIYSPDELITFLDIHSHKSNATITLKNISYQDKVLIEQFIYGREFSCIVIEPQNTEPIALPPTEMIKQFDYFDYRAKYLPGMVRKNTPIQAPPEIIEKIKSECVRLFKTLNCQVYARIDGFINEHNQIILNDPNTTAGMTPSSFLFNQAAQVGINPSKFITFIIYQSLLTRIKEKKTLQHDIQLKNLSKLITKEKNQIAKKKRIGIIMGGFSTERHISLESGKNIYQKLLSSTKYHPIAIFLHGTPESHKLTIIPTHILLKDNADDITDNINQHKQPIETLNKEEKAALNQYINDQENHLKQINYEPLKDYIDFAFISIHGRPGEDGQIQSMLEANNIPYNGSGIQASKITIDKFQTNQLLSQHNIHTAKQILIKNTDWVSSQQLIINEIEEKINYPLIAKPVDDGCSYAVCKINDREQLKAYAKNIFQATDKKLDDQHIKLLKLDHNKEFPKKTSFLIEEFISKGQAQAFAEITIGFLTNIDEQGNLTYEIFEPSQTVSSEEVLSLEEKFLAGQGQNITPAILNPIPEINSQIIKSIKKEILKTIKILNLEGYGRIDAFVKTYENTHNTHVYIIEVNSLPAMTPATCIFHQAALHGYSPLKFIEKIIEYGLKTKMKKC
jgi:UDP-N-acetylmuramate--alanine ligase